MAAPIIILDEPASSAEFSETSAAAVVSAAVSAVFAVLLLLQEQSTTVVANKDVSKTVSFLPVYFMWDFLSAGYICNIRFYNLTILYQFMQRNTITFQLQLYYSLEKRIFGKKMQPAYPYDMQAAVQERMNKKSVLYAYNKVYCAE